MVGIGGRWSGGYGRAIEGIMVGDDRVSEIDIHIHMFI